MKLNKAAAALGSKGGKAGTGKAKARTPEQASAAANARWQNRNARLALEYIRKVGLTYSLREWLAANSNAETEPPRPPECLLK